MAGQLARDAFLKSYADRGYRYPTLLRHKGTLLAFALDDQRRIVYTGLDPERGARDAEGWFERPRELRFPTELAYSGFGAAEQTAVPLVRKSTGQPVEPGTVLTDEETDHFRSSTARLTADAPFHVVTDGALVYLFRQSVDGSDADNLRAGDTTMVDGTLLVDRFVLVGGGPNSDVQLTPKREVRFQRSRSRTRPDSPKDTLGATDLDRRAFIEPTHALRFISKLTGGRFTALLVPTRVAEVSRWQVFAHNARSGAIDAYSIERSADGLFNTRGEEFFTCADHPDVFSLERGTCSAPSIGDPVQTCGRDLVPVADRGGYAGAALSFAADGSHVAFDEPEELGSRFTIELWLSATGADGEDPAAVIGSGTAATANDGPSIAVVGGRRVRVGWGDGEAFRSTTTGDVLVPGTWQHVAVTFDGSMVRVYVGGRLQHHSADLRDHAPAAGAVSTQLGAPGNGFGGAIDEARMWTIVRSALDIQGGMRRRLSGLEPGLASYWRLDEGRGDVVRDQAGNGATGTVKGAAWVTSGAPVADSAGISRTSIRIAGREVATGLSALIYYQQAEAASGYDRRPKRLKQDARVMLAVGTTRKAGQTPEIAVVDLGVGGDGRLAQLDGEVALSRRSTRRPGEAAESADERSRQQAIVDACEELIASAATVVQADDPVAALATLNGGPKPELSETERATLASAVTALNAYVDSTPPGIPPTPAGVAALPEWNALIALHASAKADVDELAPPPSVEELMRDLERQDAKASEQRRIIAESEAALADLPGRIATLEDVKSANATGTVPSVANAEDRLVVEAAYAARAGHGYGAIVALHSGRVLDVAGASGANGAHIYQWGWHGGNNQLFRFELLDDGYYRVIALNSGKVFDIYGGSLTRGAVLSQHDWHGGNNQRFAVEAVGSGYYRLKPKGSNLVLDVEGESGDDGANVHLWDWRGAKNQCFRLDGVAAAIQRDATWKTLIARLAELTAAKVKAEKALGPAQAALAEAQTRIAEIRTALNGDDNGVRMPLVAVDARGLTITGAVCAFAATTDAPRLFDSALGRISMYFRGPAGEFLVAHYETLTGRSTFGLPAKTGTVTLTGRSPELEGLTLNVRRPTVDDGPWMEAHPDEAADRCTVTIGLGDPLPVITETWRRVPRDAARLTDVLNGVAATPVFAGTAAAGTHKAELRLRERLRARVDAGSLVRVGATTRTVAVAADAGATEIALEPGAPIGVAEGDPRATAVYAIAYDYAANARSTQVPSNLSRGSRLVVAVADGAAGKVANGTLQPSDSAASRWIPVAPGRTLDLDGHSGMAKALPGHAADFAARGDVTVEAWVQPTESGGRARIVQQRSEGSDYTLALMPAPDGHLPVAGVDGKTYVQAKDTIAPKRWTHLAMAFRRGYAVKLPGGDTHLDCGTSSTLDLRDDLTIEVAVRLDAYGGTLVDRPAGADEDTPYSLVVDGNGQLVFSYQDDDHEVHTVRSVRPVQTGEFLRLAVTRKRNIKTDENPPTQTNEIKLFVGRGKLPTEEAIQPSAPLTAKTVGSSSGPTRIGHGLQGEISEVRLWSMARAAKDIGTDPRANEAGLVSRWRFAERAGTSAVDEIGTNVATFRGAVARVTSPDPKASRLTLHVDGVQVPTEPLTGANALAAADEQFTLGALGNAKASDHFQGQIEDVRIWRVERTTEEIQDNLFRRLTGDQRDDVIAYYTLQPVLQGYLTDDRVVRARADKLPPTALQLSGKGAELSLSTVPISDDAPEVRNALLQVVTDKQITIDGTPAVAEYADLQTDSAGRAMGVFKRCYASMAGTWNLTTGFKVGDMDLEWVGQVQFDPQIMGFIEGAPPVPGENLTHEESYADASAVSLTDASQTTYTYSSSRESGADQSVDAFIGVGWGVESYAGLGYVVKVSDVEGHFHVKANFESSQGWTDEATSGEGRAMTRVSTLRLRGRKRAPTGGNGAAPEKAARFVPDNTGFALVQSETADVFAMRLRHTGALISYEMRPNPDIPKDWNIVTFPINPRYTKQGTLDGKVGLEPDADFPNAETYTSDSSYFKPIEAYKLKDRIAREEQQARTRFEEYRAGELGRRQGADLTKGDLLQQLPKVEKRNLVNTYVWTADGGQFAEEVQSLDTRSEVAGGNYAFKGMGGFELESEIKFVTGMEAGITAMFGGHLNLTVTKGRDSESSFGLSVSVAPDSDLSGPGPSDARGREQGKVDAYRFMTFFLEPRSDHFDLFFNQVVDPIWLEQSADPAAAALRGAMQPAQRPACWRVMHRVTFVSRVLPATQDTPASTLEHDMQRLDIASNYELVRALDPFVRDKARDYDAFVEAVDAAVAAHLPELEPHLRDIRRFLVGYYGVTGAPGVTAVADVSAQALTPPTVNAGADQTVRLGAPVTLTGTVVDEWTDPSALSVRWVKLDGPGDVKFSDARALTTGVTFTEEGVYLLQLQAGGRARPPAFASTVVTVESQAAPVAAPATNGAGESREASIR